MNEGIGPDIWLAGDPADLDKYMNNSTEHNSLLETSLRI